MPRATTPDISLTKSYIPKVSKIPGISPTIAKFYKSIKNRNNHEGRVVDQAYYKSNNIERLFTNIRFDCLFQINEPIVPRFILDFYSQVTVQTDEYGYLFISFMIQHEFITLTLAQFGQILKIPYNGQAVFTNGGTLHLLSILKKSVGTIFIVYSYSWNDIRRTLKLDTRGHRDHLPACLAHMLYCVVAEEQYNLAYFFVKRIECARANPTANLPYGHNHSVSSSSSHHHGTSSHQHDDDDDDVETSRASTPSPTTYLNSLNPLNYQNYEMPFASEQTDER
ncbi:hypothetical protein Tco_1103050 [Tanacetum coccineum]